MLNLLTRLFGKYSWLGNLLKLKTIFDKYLPLVREHVEAIQTLKKDIQTINQTVLTHAETQELINATVKKLLAKYDLACIDNETIIDVIPETDENASEQK